MGGGGKTVPLSVGSTHVNRNKATVALADDVQSTDTTMEFMDDGVLTTGLASPFKLVNRKRFIKLLMDQEYVVVSPAEIDGQPIPGLWSARRGADGTIAAAHQSGTEATLVAPVWNYKTNVLTTDNLSGMYVVPGLFKNGLCESILRCSPSLGHQRFTFGPVTASGSYPVGPGGKGIWMENSGTDQPGDDQPGDGKLHFARAGTWLALMQANCVLAYGPSNVAGDMDPGLSSIRLDLKDGSGTSWLHAFYKAVVVANSNVPGGGSQYYKITSCAFEKPAAGASLVEIQPADLAAGDFTLQMVADIDTPSGGSASVNAVCAFVNLIDFGISNDPRKE